MKEAAAAPGMQFPARQRGGLASDSSNACSTAGLLNALSRRHSKGLKIAPLYPRVTSESTRALRQKPGAWKISQRMDHPEPETANAMARADLVGGADALTLTISQTHPRAGLWRADRGRARS